MRISDETKRKAVAEINSMIESGKSVWYALDWSDIADSSYYKWRKQFGMYPTTKTPEPAPVQPTPPKGFRLLKVGEQITTGCLSQWKKGGDWVLSCIASDWRMTAEEIDLYWFACPLPRPPDGYEMCTSASMSPAEPDGTLGLVEVCPDCAAKDAEIAELHKLGAYYRKRLENCHNTMGEYRARIAELEAQLAAVTMPTEPLALLAWYAAGFAATRREIMGPVDKADNDIGK